MSFLEKVREVGRELMEEGEYHNAQALYGRILPQFKNMPKPMRDALSETQRNERSEALHILLLNIALCHLKKGHPRDAVKFAKEAIEHNKDNPKAYYRLAVAQRLNGELEPAKLSILAAINISPADKALR